LIQNNDGTTVQLKNTQIYNSSNYGILAQTGKIVGENVVINNAGVASLACLYGGEYNFTHSTFNNNWNSSSQVAVLVSNFITGAVPESKDLTQATFNNCIIYGSYSNEMLLNKKLLQFSIINSIIVCLNSTIAVIHLQTTLCTNLRRMPLTTLG